MRASGVLMHISSLPGDFGIGTFGKYAYEFVDRLKESSQTYWQILPLCPTSYGDSPYQSFSTFAGNPYFIDLKELEDKGYLKPSEYQKIVWSDSVKSVDYNRLYIERKKVFKRVQKNFFKHIPAEFEIFCENKAFWLDDYSLFMAIKDKFGGKPLCDWDEDIRKREPKALERYKTELKDEVLYYKMLQYLFFDQWERLKSYANKNGIKIIGDLPIYVAADSSDVWSNPGQFYLDDDMQPIEVAGCPPDAFSKTGQLWGNPLYDWDFMKSDGYNWWVDRLRESLKMYDVVRIDHFRGFDSYYSIKAGSKDAVNGVWKEGPKMDLFRALKKKLGKMPLIAEDLGFLTPSVKRLLKQSGYPGMKILQFAFDPNEDSGYLPHNYEKNCIAYTGTHDNDTVLGWAKSLKRADLRFAKRYMNHKRSIPFNWTMNMTVLASVADTAIITMQDILGLSSEGRMNIPSTLGGNWIWRAEKTDLEAENFVKLYYYTKLYSRCNKENEKCRD